jgi:tRNA-Thr(GGU) m(6)t(6)A37 methyltransferase TsaA
VNIIARIHTDFPEKFGIPRQSGLIKGIVGTIIFEPKYRIPEALRGIEEFSHLWLIWQFSEIQKEGWSPTVRPPRLGGNKRMGVFATRSPFRPNPIGLSSVKLIKVEWETKNGPVLYVEGADLLDGTPIYDIKPYLSFTDCHPDAKDGFANDVRGYALQVQIHTVPVDMSQETRDVLVHILQQDPRPSYQNDADRIYSFGFSKWEIRFKVDGEILTVVNIEEKAV